MNYRQSLCAKSRVWLLAACLLWMGGAELGFRSADAASPSATYTMTHQSGGNLAILPEGNWVSDPIPVPASVTIARLDLTLGITHPNSAELQMWLASPGGVWQQIPWAPWGGSRQSFTLNNFVGQGSAGVWNLWLTDGVANGVTGKEDYCSMTVSYSLGASIATPATGATISGSYTVGVQATSASSVRIFVDDQWVSDALYNAATGRWEHTLVTTAFPDGAHTVTAVARDWQGNEVADGHAVTFDNWNIYVIFGSPANGATISGTYTVTASVPSYASRGELYVGSELVGVDTTVSSGWYSLQLDTLAFPDGIYDLRWVVYDPDGNPATALRRVTFNNYAISCSITFPAPGARVSGTITVNASVPAYAVSGELYLDGALAGLDTTVSGGQFSFSLDTLSHPDGTHTLSVVAYDPDGNSAVGVSSAVFDNYNIFATIASPGTGAPLSGTVTFWVSTASYAARGELLVDGSLYASTAALTNIGASWYHTYSVNTLAFHDGSHTVTAISIDPYGDRASHTLSYAFDNYNLYITITAPPAGAAVSGNITVNASVPSYATRGELYIDDELAGIDTSISGGQFQFNVATTGYTDGPHRLRALALDPDGSTAQSLRTVTFDNYNISVTILAPSDGATISGSATVSARVPPYTQRGELYVDGLLVSTDDPAGSGQLDFTLGTKGFPDGKHSLTVSAGDPDGEVAAHTIWVTVDNYNITCNLQWPSTGIIIAGNVTCWVSAPDYAVRGELYVDGELVATCATLSYVGGGSGWYPLPLTTRSFPDGVHRLTARAYDPDGSYASDTESPVVDNYNIYAAISSPAEGATVSGLFYVQVGVPSYAVRCELYVDGVLTNVSAAQSSGQFRVGLNSMSFADGKHIITAVAYDPDGSSASASRMVLVDNYNILVTFNSPLNGFTISGVYTVTATVPGYAQKGELYVDGALYAVDLTRDALSRYQFSLNTSAYPDGIHRLTAVAYDPDGGSGASTISGSFDNYNVYAGFSGLPPSLSGNATVLVSAPPYARRCELSVDGHLVATDSTMRDGLFELTFNTLAFHDGLHLLTATVYDPDGNYASASKEAVIDNYQIYVNMIYPASGGRLMGVETIRASAPDCAVKGELYIDSGLHSTTSRVSGELRFSVNTETLKDGPHTFTVLAYDPDGASASATVAAEVDNYQMSLWVLISPGGALLAGAQNILAYVPSYAARGEFYIDGALASTDYSLVQSGGLYCFNHTIDTTKMRDGRHTLLVIAYDPEGSGASVLTDITVDNWRISVSVTYPQAGSLNAGMVTVVASVPYYTTRGELYVDGYLLGQNSTVSADTLRFPLDTRPLGDGWHSVAVRAYDPDGESAYHSISAQFDNTPPSLGNMSVTYPPGRTAASNGSYVSISVQASDAGGSGLASVWCNATNLGAGSAQMQDDGLHNDSSSIDGIFGTGGLRVNTAMGYHIVFITAMDKAGNLATGAAKVAVDTHEPLITSSYCVYPTGQSAAKQKDAVRIVSKVVDTKMTVDVVLVMDSSGSMSGTPMSDAKTAAKTFIGNLGEYDRAAIYSFNSPAGQGGNKPKQEIAFTSNKATLNSTIDSLSADDWTPLYDTIYEAIQYAKTSANMPVVIALTDGNDELGGGSHSQHTLQDCKNASIPVYTIGLDPGPGFQKLCETVLKEIAQSSDGGAYYHAPNSSQLRQIYEDLAMVIEKMDVGGIGDVWCDASPIGGPAYVVMRDDGLHGDLAVGDGYFGSEPISVGSASTVATVVNVTAVDVAGNRDTDAASVLLDNTPPSLSGLSPVYSGGRWWAADGESIPFVATATDSGSVKGVRAVELDASGVGGPASVPMVDDGSGADQTPGDGSYTSGAVLVATGSSTGILTFKVTVWDNASNQVSQSGNIYIDNGRPLVMNITQPAPGRFVEGLLTARVRVTDLPAVERVELTLLPDGLSLPASYSMLTGYFEALIDTTSLGDGTYVLSATGRDIAGRPIPPPAPVTFYIDNHAPSLRLVSPRSGDHVSGLVEINTSGTSDEFLTSVEYRVDEGGWAGTAIMWDTTGVGDGPHTVEVRALDGAGHEARQTLKLTVDNTNPTCRIVFPGESSVLEGRVVAQVKAADAVGVESVELSGAVIGEAEWSPGSGYFELAIDTRELSDGTYTLGASARDAFGHVAQAQPVSFRVDNREPTIDAAAPANGEYLSGLAPIRISSDDGPFTDELLVSFRVDERGWVPMALQGQLWGADWDTTAVTDGPHTLTVRSEDIAGRVVQQELQVFVDNHDPECRLISPLSGQHIEGRHIMQALVRDDNGVESVTLNISGVGELLMGYNGLTGYHEHALLTMGLTDGEYSASAIARDRSGREARAGPVAFYIDNLPPSFTLLRPREGEAIQDSIIVEVSWTEGRADGEVAVVRYRIDSGPWTPANRSTSVAEISDGPHTVTVRAEDPAGHAVEVSVRVFVDKEGPSLTVVSPRDGAKTRDTVALRLRAEDAAGLRLVSLTLDSSTPEELFRSASTGFYEMELDLTGLPDGPHSLNLSAVDLSGRVASSNITVRLDTSGPEISLTSPPELGQLRGRAEFSALVTDSSGVSRVSIRLKSGEWREMRPGTGDQYEFTWDTGLNDEGSHSIEILAVDGLGNERILAYEVSVQNRSPNFIADNFNWLLLLVLIVGFAAVTAAALRRQKVQYVQVPGTPGALVPPPPPTPAAPAPASAPSYTPQVPAPPPSVPPPEAEAREPSRRPVSKQEEAEVEVLEMAPPGPQTGPQAPPAPPAPPAPSRSLLSFLRPGASTRRAPAGPAEGGEFVEVPSSGEVETIQMEEAWMPRGSLPPAAELPRPVGLGVQAPGHPTPGPPASRSTLPAPAGEAGWEEETAFEEAPEEPAPPPAPQTGPQRPAPPPPAGITPLDSLLFSQLKVTRTEEERARRGPPPGWYHPRPAELPPPPPPAQPQKPRSDGTVVATPEAIRTIPREAQLSKREREKMAAMMDDLLQKAKKKG
ncbi:MAG: Ig-like domain-containing protein [Thermoplasmatota archaeon]